MKRTVIVADGHATAARRLRAARAGEQGLQVMTIEQVAQRLAGGFLRPVDGETLFRLATEAVKAATPTELGDLAEISDLPGLPGALAATLDRVWRENIRLEDEAAKRPGAPRLRTLATLERAVLDQLPPGMLRPRDLAGRAHSNIRNAEAVLGPVELDYLLDVDPCWQVLVLLLHRPRRVYWRSNEQMNSQGHRPPIWWDSACGDQTYDPVTRPATRAVTCATARHEVIEAFRWARCLLARGVPAGSIAFAAAAPGEYDDLVLAMAAEANLPVHFAHGRRALATRDGQAAAALTDVVLHGLSQDRVRRLAALAHDDGTVFANLPEGWIRDLPRAAPLGTLRRWQQATAGFPAATLAILLPAIEQLAQGPDAAAELGETFLRGPARLLWRQALLRAPATALEGSLGALRLLDTAEANTSIGWMHAATLACCPRPHAWLLGLNARTWPREATEDPLLPDHLLPRQYVQTITDADRRAFHAIRGTVAETLVCSASRRDATGRLLGLSPLMPGEPERLRRARIPEHAMSEADRLMARPAEFANTPRASSAAGCWTNWHVLALTAHDGLVRPNHPVLLRALDRIHSATSLSMLLRNPVGFTWRYALGWRDSVTGEEALELDAMQFGSLVHGLLEAALPAIADAGGMGRAGAGAVQVAVAGARTAVAARWEAEQPVPPTLLWHATLDRAAAMAITALNWKITPLPGARSHAEVTFGQADANPANDPWDPRQTVAIPGTGIRIAGRIDRIDIAADGTRARLVDYKTGKPRDPGALDGGRELQRCLYAFAAQALLGAGVEVEASLLFPRGDGACHSLADTAGTLQTLTAALNFSCASLRAGCALPGPDTGGNYDDLVFALPAGPGSALGRKKDAARDRLGDAAAIWEVE